VNDGQFKFYNIGPASFTKYRNREVQCHKNFIETNSLLRVIQSEAFPRNYLSAGGIQTHDLRIRDVKATRIAYSYVTLAIKLYGVQFNIQAN
jgi:hypothetical protein